jgi:long-chain acyl-CoA synthetase
MVDLTVAGFYRAALACPGRLALIEPGTGQLTFGELHARANRLSHAMRGLGVGPGDVVAAMVHNDSAFFELIMATGQIGVYLVPINTHLAAEEVAFIVRDSEATVLIAHFDLAENLTAVAKDLPARRFSIQGAVPGWDPFETLDGESGEPAERVAGSVMGYTSGTTGRPKGVKRKLSGKSPEEAAAGMPRMLVRTFGLGADGVHLVTSPVYHAAPSAFAMAALHAGHTVVLHRRFDEEATLRDIERYRVTTSHMVPTHFHRMLRLPGLVKRKYDLSGLRAVVHAGAPCPVDVKRQMIAWLGPVIWEYLGATEGMVTVVGPKEWLARPGTVGRPAPGVTVKLLGDQGQEVPVGEAGTIYFGLAGVEFEYHKDPEKTRASRIGALHTVGDIGRLDEDGYLFLLDRRNDLILSGGVNIYPAEIEQHLIGHPAVADVAVIGVPDPEWGQSVLAVVQLTAGVSPGPDLAEELKDHCAGALASYKRPRRIEFRADFPRTATGKLLRGQLRDEYGVNHER